MSPTLVCHGCYATGDSQHFRQSHPNFARNLEQLLRHGKSTVSFFSCSLWYLRIDHGVFHSHVSGRLRNKFRGAGCISAVQSNIQKVCMSHLMMRVLSLLSFIHSSLLRKRPFCVTVLLFFAPPFQSPSLRVEMSAKLSNAVALVALLSCVAALPRPQYPNPSANSQPSTNLCGNDQHIILEETPWLVANSMYGAGSMVGTSCTYYDHVDTFSGGNARVVWSSTTHIQNLEST